MHDVPFPAHLTLEEFLCLPLQHLVGHSLESLTEHYEPAVDRIARAHVDVAEPALTSARAPLDSEHDEVERARGFDFDPRRTATSCGVGRGILLHHDAFVSTRQCIGLKGLCFRGIGCDDTRHAQRARSNLVEAFQSLRQRMIDEALAVVEQDVKEEWSQRQFVAQLLDVDAAAESAHGVLKGQRSAIRSERDDLPIENYLATG